MAALPQRIDNQLRIALDNLRLCQCVCEFLVESKGHLVPTEIRMSGPHRKVIIPGDHCGFATTPVVHSAILDIRRILAFLGVSFSQKTSTFELIEKPRKDDYWIKDLGLPQVTPERLNQLSVQLLNSEASPLFGEILHYSNKQLAHFSKSESEPDLGHIGAACGLVTEVVLRQVYDALQIPRPASNFSTDAA